MFFVLWLALAVVAIVLPACRICSKAGYPAAAGALALIPILNVVFLWFLAFSEWPIEKELAALRGRSMPAA
jgi:hypothetical protein